LHFLEGTAPGILGKRIVRVRGLIINPHAIEPGYIVSEAGLSVAARVIRRK
jgi:hypothetical protein